MFGRPDIGAYLTDTFVTQMDSSRSMDESGLDKSGQSDVSASERDLVKSAVILGRQNACSAAHSIMCNGPAGVAEAFVCRDVVPAICYRGGIIIMIVSVMPLMQLAAACKAGAACSGYPSSRGWAIIWP